MKFDRQYSAQKSALGDHKLTHIPFHISLTPIIDLLEAALEGLSFKDSKSFKARGHYFALSNGESVKSHPSGLDIPSSSFVSECTIPGLLNTNALYYNSKSSTILLSISFCGTY